MNTDQQINSWGQIVAKAWQDDSFKKRLVANSSTVLKEHGLELPSGLQVRIVEDTDEMIHLTLPAKPREGELSDDDLDNVAGGFAVLYAGMAKWMKENCHTTIYYPKDGRPEEETHCHE